MSTETIEIFNNSDEWANQLKHALSKGENLALLHGLTPDILDMLKLDGMSPVKYKEKYINSKKI